MTLMLCHYSQGYPDFSPVISSGSLIILNSTFRSMIPRPSILGLCLEFFSCEYPVNPASFIVEITIFAPLYYLYSFVYTYTDLFLGPLFCLIDLFLYCFACTRLSWLLQLCSKSWSWIVSVVLLSQYSLVYSLSFASQHSQNNLLGFWVGLCRLYQSSLEELI
jgi:hypothetical protein